MPTTRQRRVQELLVQEISDIIRRELRDPHLGFLTITDAEITPDLRQARVFFSVLGEPEQQKETGKILNRAAGFIRGEFGRRAQMRFTPELRFEFDPSAERGTRMSQLLEQVRQDDERRASESPGSSDQGSDDPGTPDRGGGGAGTAGG
jgi:ribosome-binding factor A